MVEGWVGHGGKGRLVIGMNGNERKRTQARTHASLNC